MDIPIPEFVKATCSVCGRRCVTLELLGIHLEQKHGDGKEDREGRKDIRFGSNDVYSAVKVFTEQEAREVFERARWPEKPICSRCGSWHVTRYGGVAALRHLIGCIECGYQFTVISGTLMDRSHMPARFWLWTVNCLCNIERGISALRLSKLFRSSYKSAWLMMRKVGKVLPLEKRGRAFRLAATVAPITFQDAVKRLVSESPKRLA